MTLYEYDRSLQLPLFCGVDEAGRGPLAGDVYAAAVILPLDAEIPGINDSKKLSEKKRDALYEWLAGQMGLPLADCHFGYFDLQQLRQAYRLLSDVQGLPMRYDNRGRIFFEERRSA